MHEFIIVSRNKGNSCFPVNKDLKMGHTPRRVSDLLFERCKEKPDSRSLRLHWQIEPLSVTLLFPRTGNSPTIMQEVKP
ncbi:MAG TPA: hypothetical protein VFU15_00470, partial [Bacteroidia bacterium]|nr:hypothetical protein [Bacteroidia bacterium]